jgi:hypothetical protein
LKRFGGEGRRYLRKERSEEEIYGLDVKILVVACCWWRWTAVVGGRKRGGREIEEEGYVVWDYDVLSLEVHIRVGKRKERNLEAFDIFSLCWVLVRTIAT